MNKNEQSNILIEKLSLQISSFQEGFKILSDAKNLNEIGENFIHLLRGNLLATDINLFYKKNEISEWENLFINKEKSKEFQKHLILTDSFNLNIKNDLDYKVFATLKCIDDAYFGLIIGNKFDNSEFNSFDSITLQIFIRLLDNSYQNYVSRTKERELIFSLNHKVLQLNSLVDTGIEISKLENNTQLLELALERAVALTNASKGIIRIINNNKLIASLRLPNNIDITETLASEDKIETEVEYKGYNYIVTLVDKESRFGKSKFNQTDEILLSAFARQVYGAVENKELHKEALENETLKKEISVASSIQKKIIPETLPNIKDYEIAGFNIPSKEVGGDYYDCIDLGDGIFALIIADVAGKGIGAALLVSTLNAALYSYLQFDIPLSEMADRLNKLIYKSSPPDKFITFFIAVLNSNTGELDILNAGHNPILLLRKDGSLENMEAGGVGLGMFDFGIPFTGQKLKINSGDKLFLYTDGIPEAMNENEEEYTDEKMINFLINHSQIPAKDFIELLIKDVKDFVGNTQQSDDITLLILKKN